MTALMLDVAIKQVERDIALAHDQVRLTREAHAVAMARFLGLVEELVRLCEAHKQAERHAHP